MKNDIVLFEEVAYLERSKASVKLNAPKQSSINEPGTPVLRDPDKEQNLVASWGTDNLRPQNIIASLAKIPQAKAILSWKARALYSGGLIYGVESEDGTFQQKRVPEVESFFRESNIKRYLIEACVDYYWFYNPFTEFILNGKRDIIAIASQDASFCRVGIQDPKTGRIPNVFINADWSNPGVLDPKAGIPLINPYYGRFDQLRKSSEFKFIYSCSFPSPGKIYYQEGAWHALVESGWLDVAAAIPAFKKALFKNQMTIKYHIEIATWFWEWKYEGKWASFTPEKKRDEMRATLNEIDSVLAGSENAGKSVHSWKKIDETGKEISAITIHTLDDKIKSGIYIEDSQEAFSNIMFSMETDPTLVGNAPGKQMGSGSGSDKRVAFNIYMLNCKADQDIILEPLEYIRDYNGWDPSIKFMFKNYYIATLDQGKEVSNNGGKN